MDCSKSCVVQMCINGQGFRRDVAGAERFVSFVSTVSVRPANCFAGWGGDTIVGSAGRNGAICIAPQSQSASGQGWPCLLKAR